ncbi:MAG: hypothetical protein OXQ31_09515 [Spirochaetaceae bacterium]|nr:hypothetical protein [Spirochaetaceae bacterium]
MNELEATPIDITQLLIALARLAYFNREYSAGNRAPINLTMPDCWTSPTAERMTRWLLKFPSNLSRVEEIAEAVILDYPIEARTDYERLAHRAGEYWLRNFRDGYTLSDDGAAGYWTPDMWLDHAVPALSGLVVAYLSVKPKTQRQHLYDFMSAWQLCPKATESLFETTNFRPEVLDAADRAAPDIIGADKYVAAEKKVEPFRGHVYCRS